MSKLIPKFKGKVENGKLILERPQIFNLYLGGLENKVVEVIVQKQVKSRSDKMNRYYWAFLHVLEQETGDDANNLHEYFKRVLLPPQIIEVFGKEIKLPATTTKLSQYEFTNYISKIERLTGIKSPDPDEFYSL